jgi:hypothetical protein
MRTATLVTQIVLRLCFLTLLVLGIIFWTGHALTLINVHMAVGGIFVLAMWVMCILGAKAKVGGGLVGMTAVGGIIVLALGMTQMTLMVGSMHWIVRVLHLLVGLAAMGLAEQIGRRIKT